MHPAGKHRLRTAVTGLVLFGGAFAICKQPAGLNLGVKLVVDLETFRKLKPDDFNDAHPSIAVTQSRTMQNDSRSSE